MEAELRALVFDAVAGFGTTESLSVAYPNVPFDRDAVPVSPGASAMYLAAALLPTTPEPIEVSEGRSNYLWIAQVLVYARDGIGELHPLRVAESLFTEFPYRRVFTGASYTFQVVRPATAGTSAKVDGWYFIPVSFRIQSFR